MSIRYLEKMFSPSSIAVFGATPQEKNAGNVVIRNLMKGGFNGPIMPVSQTQKSVCGILSYPSVSDLPLVPDLAVFCQAASGTQSELASLGEAGCKAVMYVSSNSQSSESTPDFIPEISSKYKMRILGPNSMGAMIPAKNLNVSTLHLPAPNGKIAYVSQSGAMCSTVLDWARAHGVGFSHFISLGACADIAFGDIIDYLGSDPFTRAVLLYMESIQDRRNFMSAARSSARNKPLIVMKAGKYEELSHVTQSHTGAMAGADLVYDAAFRRAGMLRVNSTAELFAGAETLSMTKPFNGKRLAIVSNGGGLNILATDHLLDFEGQLAKLSEETVNQINSVLGTDWNGTNPIDVGPSKTAQNYAQVYEILKKSRDADCILFLHAPSISNDSETCAKSLIEAHKKLKGNLLTCWVGEETAGRARHLFEDNNIPTYTSPRMAVMAFMHIVQYRENQVNLIETPERVPAEVKPARATVRQIIDDAIAEGESWLKESDSKAVLKAYGINCVETHIAKTVQDAKDIANKIGYPVVVKVMSHDIIHKSDVGGVVLSLLSEQAVEDAVNGIVQRVEEFNPQANIYGFIVQNMVNNRQSHELIAGMTHDPVFGPVIMFGEGGVATEVIGDRAIALPPLNMVLAKDLISRTNISKLLGQYRDHPPVDMDALCQVLIELSEICIDFPEIQEMEINPIFSSSRGALAVDSRMKIKKVTESFPNRRLAIRPYPAEYEEEFELRNGRKVLIRPIKPEDEPAHNEFLKKVTPEDIRFRFFGSVRELPHSEMARLTQIDYDRQMAFIAQAPSEDDGHMETLGVVRTGTDPNNEDAEYAILVRSDLKGQKLGWKLLNKIIEYSRSRGTTYFSGQILRENRTMIEMVKAMGFEARTNIEEDVVEVKLKL